MASSPPPSPDRLRILWLRMEDFEVLDHGGKIYTYHLLKHLKQLCHVHVLHSLRPGDKDVGGHEVPYAHECEGVYSAYMDQYAPSRFFSFIWPILRNLFASREPFALTMFHSETYARRARELEQTGRYDLIIVDGLFMAPIFEGLKTPRRTPAILLQHNAEAQIWRRMAELQRNPVMRFYFHEMARRLNRREPELCRLFEGVTTISDKDAEFHRHIYKLDNVLGCVPAGGNPDARALPAAVVEQSPSPCIAFLGSMNWPPNADAAFWFVAEIFPLIRKSMPDVRFRVIGREPPEALRRLAAKNIGIEVTGPLPEVLTSLRECALLVVPLRAGSGVRLKILESMAAGVPVVSTTVGAEGLHMRDGQDLLLADDAAAMSEAVLRMLRDNVLRKTLAENALERVTQDFAWSKGAEKLMEYGTALHRKRHHT